MRLIDADALIKYCDDNWIPLNVDAVNEQPTIKPKRKKGKWIDRGYMKVGFHCSECGGYVVSGKENFCPNCGSDMRTEP